VGVTAEALVEQMVGTRAEYGGSFEEAVAKLVSEARDGDVILTMGAGNVSQASGMLMDALRA